jgi:hypothetical protein
MDNIKVPDAGKANSVNSLLKLENMTGQNGISNPILSQEMLQSNNINSDSNYQNPSILIKTDEKSMGISAANRYSAQTYYANSHGQDSPYLVGNMSAPSPNMSRQGFQNSQNDDFNKHRTGSTPQNDAGSNQMQSYAPGPYANSTLDEHKDNNDSDEAYSDDPKSRTSASSRVNFSKLTAEEKERRCHNMSKEVKQLRRKIRNMEERLARSSTGMEFRTGDSNSEDLNFGIVHRAQEKIKSYKGYELSDQKDLIENICNVITQEKLKPDSLPFYMICTLIRAHLTPDELNKYEAEGDGGDDQNKEDKLENKEILISLPEKEVKISKKEYQYYAPYQENEQIMRLLTGQLKENPEALNQMSQMNLNGYNNEQLDLLNKVMQANNSNQQNLSMQNMQSLLNNPMLSGLVNQSPMCSSNGMGGLQMPLQNQYSNQMMNSLMGASMGNSGYSMNPMSGGMNGQNYPNLNDLIQNQMMNFNSSYMNQMNPNPQMNNQNKKQS